MIPCYLYYGSFQFIFCICNNNSKIQLLLQQIHTGIICSIYLHLVDIEHAATDTNLISPLITATNPSVGLVFVVQCLHILQNNTNNH